jgi:LacI family transcriptional regulator
VVFIGDYLPGISASSVTLDSIDCINKVLQHLYEIGRRNVRLLAVDYKSTTLLEREEAFRNGLKRLGLPLYSDSIVYAELAKETSVFERAKQIIESQKGVDAILGISDSVALVALATLNRMGVKVPDKVAVAGIANLLYTNYPFLGLTTVDECCHELGRRAAALMIRQIDQAIHETIQYEHIRLKGPLIIRQSTSGTVAMI